jgi:hypothetical protein
MKTIKYFVILVSIGLTAISGADTLSILIAIGFLLVAFLYFLSHDLTQWFNSTGGPNKPFQCDLIEPEHREKIEADYVDSVLIVEAGNWKIWEGSYFKFYESPEVIKVYSLW